jgi:outer membrane protein assembly factor BamE
MQWLKFVCLSLTLVLSAGCSNWLYRMPIPQGNFLEQKDIDKLRVEMTQEQVLYVLGKPIATDAFNDSKWYYVYLYNPGRDSEQRKELVIVFENKKVKAIEGDFEQPKEFNTPLDQ